MASTSAYPVQLDIDAPLEVARWRPLVHWILATPHIIVLTFLGYVQLLLVIIAWFAILFTKNIPKGLFDLMAMILRYQWRVLSYFGWMHESYPPFDFSASAADLGGHPAGFDVAYPDQLSRVLIFVKWLLILPHFIALAFVYFAAIVAVVTSFFVVLVTGRWPEGLRNFIVGSVRWAARMWAYLYLMTDVYPPFSLQP